MRQLFILLLVVVLATSCGVSRRVSKTDVNTSWVGHSTTEILLAMGDPDRIEDDGKGGSIILYEAKPDYEDPSYDILDPNSAPSTGGYAYFYVDRYGDCYWVDATRKLPCPEYDVYTRKEYDLWVDILFYLPLILVGILL